MLYAILTADLLSVRELREFTPPLPSHKPGRILPVTEGAKPTPTDAQDLVQDTITVRATDVLRTWKVVAKNFSPLETLQRAAFVTIKADLLARLNITVTGRLDLALKTQDIITAHRAKVAAAGTQALKAAEIDAQGEFHHLLTLLAASPQS